MTNKSQTLRRRAIPGHPNEPFRLGRVARPPKDSTSPGFKIAVKRVKPEKFGRIPKMLPRNPAQASNLDYLTTLYHLTEQKK